MADESMFCELCACQLEQSPCEKCELLEFICKGTCVCCQDYRKSQGLAENISSNMHDESLGDDRNFECDGNWKSCETWRKAKAHIALNRKLRKISSSKESSACSENVSYERPGGMFCELCACQLEERPCVKCELLEFVCKGTCTCCQGYRRRERLIGSTTFNMHDESLGDECLCRICMGPCPTCKDRNFGCDCTWKSCETWRKARAHIAVDEQQRKISEDSSACSENVIHDRPEGFCNECLCQRGERPCIACVKMKYNCDGSCSCCEGHRRKSRDN